MRPKSMATVVEVLRSLTPPASSTPTECSVIAASVESGSMSEIEPMKVVLPTAKPPATTIFTVMGAVGGVVMDLSPGTCCAGVASATTSERGNAIENTLQNLEVRGCGCGRRRTGVDDDQPLVGEVADEDADHAEGQGQVCRQLRHREDRGRAELDDAPTFRRAGGVGGTGDASDQRLERQVAATGAGPATGQRVRPHGARLLDDLVVVEVVRVPLVSG